MIEPDSTGFTFTDVKINRHGSVKDQNKVGNVLGIFRRQHPLRTM